MKDKILPLDYDQYSVEELTEKANKIIESLENENDLNNAFTYRDYKIIHLYKYNLACG